MGINVLSLFDGVSCGKLALERAGFSIDKYYASEIDKYAINVSMKNHSDIIHLGDINDWEDWDIDWTEIDLVIGGSPCQSFSPSGRRGGLSDERGKLLLKFVEIRDFVGDAPYMLENVRMTNAMEQELSDVIGVAPFALNSSIFSALHRDRRYWTNFDINTLPPDEGILLKDILEKPHEDMPWLSDKAIARLDNINIRAKKNGWGWSDCILTEDDKYLNLDANYYKGCDGKRGVICQEGRLRMLTVTEGERLQTLPDGYTAGVSNTQRYKMLGNAWTVDAVAHILKSINI